MVQRRLAKRRAKKGEAASSTWCSGSNQATRRSPSVSSTGTKRTKAWVLWISCRTSRARRSARRRSSSKRSCQHAGSALRRDSRRCRSSKRRGSRCSSADRHSDRNEAGTVNAALAARASDVVLRDRSSTGSAALVAPAVSTSPSSAVDQRSPPSSPVVHSTVCGATPSSTRRRAASRKPSKSTGPSSRTRIIRTAPAAWECPRQRPRPRPCQRRRALRPWRAWRPAPLRRGDDRRR